ncbi:MAG TPA: hypothetical protein VG993_12970 [Actinomycetota bacterium]|jgi:hypothetical protein|nr:hypothetical protein [Actinomycetota bacterium]
MAIRMADRVAEMGERAKARQMSRLDEIRYENDKLKSEVRLLNNDLQEERGALARALDALGRDERITVETKAPKRRGRVLRTVVIGAGAYLLGTRAGRERYEQIVGKARSLTDSVREQGGQRSGTSQGPWSGGSPTTRPTGAPSSGLAEPTVGP